MGHLKHWIQAFRLRTLPLALASIILGSFLAAFDKGFNMSVTLLAALTTVFLQVLSNLANDYGDSKLGTDNEDRIGPSRSVQSGAISAKSMKKATIVFIALSLISGSLLVYEGTQGLNMYYVLGFLTLGLLAVAAAVKYTIGKNPYGYRGLGDLFVFLFFGLTGVLGTYYLNTHKITGATVLPAVSLGFLSAAVLNLNNMRDRESDKKSGKNTLVVLMGISKARIYHGILVFGAIVTAVIYILLNYESPWQFLFLITFPILFRDFLFVWKNKEPAKLDPYLKRLALTTLLFSISFGIGLII